MADRVNKERLILGFHKFEGDFFRRLVHDLGQDPTNMRWVIAFWLWLESAGHHDFVRRASELPGPTVLRFIEEAITCLRCLAREGKDGDRRVTRLPCTNAFLAKPIDDVGYFVDRRDEVLKGVTYIYKTICLLVCVSNVAATRVPGNTGGASAAPPKISSPVRPAPLVTGSADRTASLMMNSPSHAAPVMMSSPYRAAPPIMPPSTLNPMASPWEPMQVQSALPEDYRSLFVTFFKGDPVSRNSMFGPCVEEVVLENVQPAEVPMYRRVVLHSAAMIPVVLGGQQTANFVMKGRHPGSGSSSRAPASPATLDAYAANLAPHTTDHSRSLSLYLSCPSE